MKEEIRRILLDRSRDQQPKLDEIRRASIRCGFESVSPTELSDARQESPFEFIASLFRPYATVWKLLLATWALCLVLDRVVAVVPQDGPRYYYLPDLELEDYAFADPVELLGSDPPRRSAEVRRANLNMRSSLTSWAGLTPEARRQTRFS